MYRRLLFAGLLILSASSAIACGSSSTSPSADATMTISYVSRIQEHGSAWRSFTVGTAGAVTVQLTAVSQSGAVMGLGLGTVSGTTCVLSQSVQTAASSTASSPQISATLPVGTYCVKLSDIGNLTTIVDFSIAINIPYTY
jgi:hypothetical protein